MRILLHSRAFLPQLGGIEQASAVLATGLARRGHEVTVATDVTAPPHHDEAFPFAVLRARPPRALVAVAQRCDLVHANGFSLVAVTIARAAHRPVVVTHAGFQASCLEGSGLHGRQECGLRLRSCVSLTAHHLGLRRCARQLLRHVAGRLALPLVAANVSVSRAVADGVRAPRGSVVENCVDASLFRPRPATGTRQRLLFVGRFVEEKGIDVLLEALAVDRSTGGRLALDLVGGGPREAELRRACALLDLGDRVRFRGILRGLELAQAIADSLAVLVPSLCREAFGLVAAEAISCGRVPLVSDRGGLPEVVGDLELTLPAGDARTWAASMRRLAQDERWRAAKEASLLAGAGRFSPDRHVEAYLEVYRQVLA
jgi:glycosyltransferase involved in cell wall biosynthesis